MHAFLIIAHNNFKILEKLVSQLDYELNDIYIHVDKKSEIPYYITTHKSKLYWINNRHNVYWGNISLVEVELLLMQTAYNSGVHYEYYHLLSGVDLLLKDNDYIHAFFKRNKGKEFVGFATISKDELDCRINKYFIFTKYFALRNKYFFLKKILEFIEFFLNIFYRYDNILCVSHFAKGTNWFSITHDFCAYTLSKYHLIIRRFKHTLCPDEIFLHTLLLNSSFRRQIYDFDDEFRGCMREIDWNRGYPYVWGQNLCDLELLKKSDKLFARKFDEKISGWIIDNL